MKLRFPLYAQIIFVFICNMLLLYGIFLFSFCSRFNLEWESLVYAPVTDRVQFISMVIHRQLQESNKSEWNRILQEFGKFYGVTFFIFDSDGEELAGKSIVLPELVSKRVLAPHFRPPDSRGPFGLDEPIDSKNDFNPAKHLLIEQMQPDLHAGMHENLNFPSRPRFQPESLPSLNGSEPPHTPIFFMGPPGRFIVHTSNPNQTWFGAPMPFFERNFGKPTMLVAMTSNVWQTKLVADFAYILFVLVGLVGFSSVVWWPFIYMTTSAINKLTRTTEKIADGNFDVALNLKRRDEIGRLADAINMMAGRLRMFVSGQKRFLGDIAHELCSPIARLQMATAILESNSSAEQQRTVDDIKEEIEQMSSLINELLAFSKAGVLGPELELGPVDLHALLTRVCTKPEFSEKIISKLSAETQMAQGDEVLLERAICNVLRNACRYAGNCGPIELSAFKDSNHVCIKICDNGPGVPAETIELLGQPFYRPEPSRNRNYGGIGLGLAIVKTCIEACNGTFHLRNRQPSGLEVMMILEPATEAKAKLTAALLNQS